MKLTEGERTRLKQVIARHRAQLEAIEIVLMRCEGPFGAEVAQAIVQGALEIATTITRHDAFDQVEHAERAR